MLTIKSVLGRLRAINNEIAVLNTQVSKEEAQFAHKLEEEMRAAYNRVTEQKELSMQVLQDRRNALRKEQNNLLLSLADDEQRPMLKNVLDDASRTADIVSVFKTCKNCNGVRPLSDFRFRPYSRYRVDVCRPCESAARKERRHRKEREAQ